MANGQEEKPNISEHVNIKVVAQDGNEIQFKLKRHAPLRKLMNAYNERQGHAEGTVVFLYEGTRVRTEDTPDALGMEEDEGNQIDVMVAQTGGCL